MAKRGKDEAKKAGVKAWGHYRSPVAKLIRRGDETVLEADSNKTTTDVQLDYPPLLEEVRQLDRYVASKRNRGQEPTADEVMARFHHRGNAGRI